MNMILSVDKKGAISYRKKLLINIPSDMKWLIKETEGKIVVMGPDVLECLPGKITLDKRINIVINTESNKFVRKNDYVVNCIDEALKVVEKINRDDVYFVGRICRDKQIIDKCRVLYLTEVNYIYQADEFFVDIDNSLEWQLVAESDEQTYYDIEYICKKYERR